eukprot:gene914-221_t
MTQESNTEKGMSNTNGETGVLHPSITATIEKEPVRIMIDTGASSSYICTEVITKLNLKPIRREHRNIEQMYGTVRKIVEIYKVTLQSQIDNGFSVEIECINAEKDVLTTLPNPNIKALKERLPRLRRLSFTEESNKGRNVPIHIILGVGDYQQIRTSEPLIFGSQPETDPVAEFTKLGWTLLGGKNCTNATQKQFLLTTGQEEFEQLCSLDVLGITGNQETKNEFSHENFKDQIRNRVNKIKELSTGSWNYVPTKQNPSDLGTRGIKPSQLGDLWFKGPSWLARQEDWPDQPEVVEDAEAQTERIRTKLMVTKEDDGNKADVTEFMNCLLSRYNYSKLMRITAYVLRFVAKCRGIKEQGPLNSAEYRRAENTWIKITQQNVSIDCDLMKQEHDDGIWHVNGRIVDYQPILLPKQGFFVERLVEHCHKQTLHGGVQSTMSKIRQRFWIPRLRNLVKKIVHRCEHCKRYRKRPLSAPATAILPAFRTELTEPFEFDRPVLTPNILLRGTPARFLEEDLDKINDFGEVTKRVKYLKTCREQLRKRWLSEYLRALEERHRRISGTDQALPTVGSVVLMADNVAIKPKWTLGRIVDIVRGRDHVIRGFKIKNVNGYICERPIQMVKDLEIHPTELDQNKTGDSEKKGSSEPKEARPSRRAKTYANDKIVGLAFNDEEEQD